MKSFDVRISDCSSVVCSSDLGGFRWQTRDNLLQDAPPAISGKFVPSVIRLVDPLQCERHDPDMTSTGRTGWRAAWLRHRVSALTLACILLYAVFIEMTLGWASVLAAWRAIGSEEGRVGKGCVRTCRSRWARDH